MGAEDNGLTLEGLAQRLEALERENERMRSENAALRDEVSALRGSGTHRREMAALRRPDAGRSGESLSEFEGQVSRRSLLSKAGAAAVAAVAAGTTLLHPREAQADHTTNTIDAYLVRAHWIRAIPRDTSLGDGIRSQVDHNVYSGVKGENFGFGPGVFGQNLGTAGDEGPGVEGLGRPGLKGRGMDSSSHGVEGEGLAGVVGKSSTTGFEGVYGQHTGTVGFGVVGDGKGEEGAGVLGRNDEGTGVHGQSSKTGYGGVTAEHTGTAGFGVIGLGTGATGAGVLGRNSSGNGVQGEGNYGGQFEGGRAQLRLVPKATAGKPTTGAHTKGEIYMDSAGTLFVCTANGTPGTWRKVTTTAV